MSQKASPVHRSTFRRFGSAARRLPFVLRVLLLLVAWLGASQPVSAQETWTLLPNIPDFKNTEAKPQSKVWFMGHTFWTVLAGSGGPNTGTWLLRLEPDNTWAYVQQLSTNTGTKADVKTVGNVVHILMHNSGSQLVSLEYVAATKTYQPWSVRPTRTNVYIGETGTIDIDSTGRMWLATESVGIEVFYSDYPYSAFTGPIVIANDVDSDDIASVAALPNNTIGVFWSNQATRRFGFKYHQDGADPNVWSADEGPGTAGAVENGIGLAEDHINLAVGADGTLYAAIKTGYSAISLPTIGLFVRRPNGTWDDLYYVDTVGTRPIVVVNDETHTVQVFYTSTSGTVYYRRSDATNISFGPIFEVMSGGFNNLTSVKDAWVGRLLFLTSNISGTSGVVIESEPGLVAHWKMDDNGGDHLRDISGWGNDATFAGSPAFVSGVKGYALDLDGASNAVVADQAKLGATTGLTIAGWIQPFAQVDQDIVSRATMGSVDGYTLGLSSASSPAPGTVFLQLNQASFGDIYKLSSISQYPVGGYSWMHVAATYDGATMRIFINGVEEASMPGPASIAANDVALGIGAQGDGTRRFRGTLDDVKIYDKALSGAEIGALAADAPPQADLAITKDDFITKVNLGDPITYVIQASNFGPDNVVGAMITDLMPPQLANVTWTCSATIGASCGGASGSGSIIDFVNLPVGASVTYTVHASLSAEASGTFMTNTARIRASHTSDPVAGNNSATDIDELPFIIEAHFNEGADGFVYADDLYKQTEEPAYADGAYAPASGFNGGGLRVALGFVNSRNIADMSGGFQRSFTLSGAGPATLSFRYKLSMIDSRTDRYGEVLVALNGVLKGVAPNNYVTRLFGTGGGGTSTTDWQLVTMDLGELPAGTHILSLGGFLKRKSDSDEGAEILIDNVRLISGAPAGPGGLPAPPSIVTPPASSTVTVPGAAVFSVVVAGDAPFTYQWRRNGVNIDGANGTSYLLNPTAVADSGAQFDVVVSNAGGTVTSVAAALTVLPAPVAPGITMHPASLTVTEPGAASFSVVATGDAPLSYQWRRNGIAIGGATSSTYMLSPTAMIDNSVQFDVIVSNAVGTLTSAPATLTVLPAPVPPSITTHPASLTVVAPNAAIFSVVATGDAPLSYQWKRDGFDIVGATSSSYTVNPTAVSDTGAQFSVVVTNGAGSAASSIATLTVNAAPVPPSITTQPVSVTVTAPASATFTVEATGDPTLTYQWRRNGTNIAGATSATYVKTPTSVAADNGSTYSVVVTNGAGSVTSANATLTVNPAPVPPSITTQPASTTVTAPAAATFSVVATGTAPLSYQWRRNGVDIAGATSASYVLDPTAIGDNSATFDVVVTNAAASVTSSAATLTVLEGLTSVVFEAHFEGSSDNFSYADDIFGTTKPNYAAGAHVATGGFSGGGLRVALGFIDGQNIADISGGFQRSITLASAGPATLTFRYKLSMIDSRTDRYGDVLVSLNGVRFGVPPNNYITRLFGTGGGGTSTTDWQTVTIDLGSLPAGNHVLSLGGFLKRKSNKPEGAEILIDDVVMTIEQ